MKNLTLLLIACGLIFAASPVAFNLENNNVYASIDMRRYLPRPIIIPAPDTVLAKTDLAAIDMRKYLPRPIVIPIVEEAKTEIIIVRPNWNGRDPKPIIIPVGTA